MEMSPGDITDTDLRLKGPHAVRVYLARHFFALLTGIVLVAVTLVTLITAPYWTLYLRAILLARVSLSAMNMLSVCVLGGFPLMELYRAGEDCSSLAATSSSNLLYMWRVLNLLEIFVIQPISVIGNIASLLAPPPEPALARLALDIAWIVEARLSTLLIFELGIRRNVYDNITTQIHRVCHA